MYSSTSTAARNVCHTIGANFAIQFVEVFVRNGKTYVRGTIGKPDEFRWLKTACAQNGYVYSGR